MSCFRLFLLLGGFFLTLWTGQTVWANEPPPVPYRTAPLIPGAKPIGENRFRSPKNFDETVSYYKKVLKGEYEASKEKIVTNSEVRAVHFRNQSHKGNWDGLNVVEYKEATTIFVVFSDAELRAIQKEKKPEPPVKGTKSKTK
jgi:hypothetical protein